MKLAIEEGSQEDDSGGESLDERLNAVVSKDAFEMPFEGLRNRGVEPVADMQWPTDRHLDPELHWYSSEFVADSSWGVNQADLVKRILNPPKTAAEAKRATVDPSEAFEMFSDRAKEGTLNPPSTSYGSSLDGLDHASGRADWKTFGQVEREETGRDPGVKSRGVPGIKFGRDPRMRRGLDPEVNLQGRPKSAGLTGGEVFRTQGGSKDVWRRGGREFEGDRQEGVRRRGEGLSGGKKERSLRGAVRDQGEKTETGQRRGLWGQPRGFRHVAGETVPAGTSAVPETERVSGVGAGEASGESGSIARLEPQYETGFGADFETGFVTGYAGQETGFELGLQPGLPNGGLDEELELFVERLGALGNPAQAAESDLETVAFGSIPPPPDFGYAEPKAPGGVNAQSSARGGDPFTWTAQDRRSWKSREPPVEMFNNFLPAEESRNSETSPFETAAPVGAWSHFQTPETHNFETRRWEPKNRDNLPPASIPPFHPLPIRVPEPPSKDAPPLTPSHLVWGENQELPPTAFYDEHFLERFQYTRPPPNRNLPLFLDIKGHDTSPELPMPPPYYPKNSTHEKSGPLPGYPHGRVPRPKLPGPLLNGRRPDFWVVNPNDNKLVVPRAAKMAPRGKLPGVRKLLEGWTGRGVRTREEVLGGPLSDAEVADLIEGSVHDRREVYLGRDGLTWNMVGLIHTHWRRRPVCKVKCKGIFTVDMPKLLRELERSAGGRVIWQHCGTVLLFRGRNYHWRDPPILEPPEDRSADKKLTQETNPVEDRNPGGMGKLKSLQLSRRMNREPPIVWLDKNGYYGGLVNLVRTFFSEPKNDLAVIKCPKFVPGDVVKLAIQLKALVPADVFQVDKDRKQRIVLYRNAGWERPTDELTRLAETNERPTYYPKGPPQKRRTLRKVVEEQLLGEEEEDEGVWANWGSLFDAPSDEETEEL
ncbi:CRM domain containing protein [Klebsormidium nitens]|uniref:CRM domain containing protein n=1 Tax=Klebsormidium nitens TaxID=105231 RepID=A0A1Y1I6Q3_KLENI|nr:CRM domain containing protein [Klebsormidium nitens]|eukprot:GAQ84416.1 CRM domain containing protein [Klebsormidium nitens]